ncbi:restriction endonuclease subunit S [Nitrosomonas sp.]|uniref:restriction endonuclease subunit S n=1 Tax=Nitrosomonas sp. TaxID=42353 RepID=UPI001D9741FE|nr:restriction endonuclease subunit S [Nitrosomonas sp.]MBX9637475.1 restriction endonuclease subunit S [Nitrosomonas sp.]MBY0484100.1 restriction endonuclease subunit S [Nitrosomonas sp.]
MSAETPGVASDKKQNAEAPTSKTPPTTIRIPPFEKGGLGGISGGQGGIPGLPGEIWNLEGIQLLTNHLEIWTTAETEKKSGRGRSGGNGTSVYGIKKLRELILELAVRGKLVPQDPNDEPAGELLKRIQVEKARLMAEGKIKKDKPLPPIADEEKPFELPQGWEWVKAIELLSKIGAGSTPLGGKQVYVNSGIPFLRSQNVWDNGLKLDDVAFITSETHQKMSGTQVCAGDLLFNITGASIGRCAIVPDNFETGNVSQHVTIVRPVSKEILLFLHLVLISKHVQQTVMDVQVGVSREGLSIGKLSQFIIPIPPLPEQHRIVAKVDELMALCDQLETQHNNAAEAHEKLVSHLLGTLTQSHSADDFNANWQRIAAHFDTLFTTEASIDALKQTLLQLAVMGKLVPQNSNDEPASELLKRIQAEKAKLVAEGKIKKDKPLPPISEEEKPFELPRGWEWVRLCEITSKITDGDHKTPPRILDGFRLLSAKNVRDGHLDLDNCDFISKQDYLKSRERCCPDTGDLLIVSVGGTIGRTSLVPDYSDFALVRSVALIKPLLLNSFYLKQAMDSNLLQESIHARKRGGAQPCLYLSEIEQFVFSLPPLAEQHRIVTKVNELMTLCDQLKSRITQASQLQKKLADGVVEQAIAS